MKHTKKYVLVDPRFVKPSMRDKALSELDTDISNNLNDDTSDEIKTKKYMAMLARYKKIYAPAKPEKEASAVAALPQAPTVSFKTVTPPKRPHKRVKVETVHTTDPTLWRRTQRTPTKKKFGPQWLSYSDLPKKRKAFKTWVDL